MRIAPGRYIYPPRTQNVIPPEELHRLDGHGFLGQPKFNDTRCLLTITGAAADGDKIQLWNRHASRISGYQPSVALQAEVAQISETLGLAPDGYHILDGGLLHLKHTAVRDTLVLWDILVDGSELELRSSYQSRFSRLQALVTSPRYFLTREGRQVLVGHNLTEHIFVPAVLEQDQWDPMWAELIDLNQQYAQPLIEGLVLKQPDGLLELGRGERNNTAWSVKCRVQTRRHIC